MTREKAEKKEICWEKIGFAAAAGLAVILTAFISMAVVSRGRETYRSIKIVELSGGVAIDRDGVGRINASENMNLMSGDRVATETESYVVLQLDADKYVMLEEGGAIQVVAEGGGNSTKTEIHLEQGSILNDIQSPLNRNSSYEIVTPSATMSVRRDGIRGDGGAGRRGYHRVGL